MWCLLPLSGGELMTAGYRLRMLQAGNCASRDAHGAFQATAEVAPEEAIRALQMMLPPPARGIPEPVELENVSPALLLPPSGGAVTAALAGGQFELGDRVACLRGTGTPPLGLRGTVVGEGLPTNTFASEPSCQ